MTSRTIRLRDLRPGEDDLVFEAVMGTINWCGPRFTERDGPRQRTRFVANTGVSEQNRHGNCERATQLPG